MNARIQIPCPKYTDKCYVVLVRGKKKPNRERNRKLKKKKKKGKKKECTRSCRPETETPHLYCV